jgi:uncharacterized protein YndB with AHSA1/START domain
MNIPDQIERVLTLPVPQARVWAALTTPQGISQWFSTHAEFELQVGSKMLLHWEKEGITAPGQVEKIDPPHEFAFRWLACGAGDTQELTPTNSTLVSFTLKTVDGGTCLTLRETGFAALDPKQRLVARPEHESGWTMELQELVDYLTRC